MTVPIVESEITYSEEVNAALAHLLHSLDKSPFSIDEDHYYALSELPLTYPWPSITIDLREYLPFLERHLVTHLVGGLCQVLGRQVHAHTVLDSLLRNLAESIVNGIFSQHTANYAPPQLPSCLLSSAFWHAHLNNACSRAVSPLGGTGTLDNMAGDQLAIWNQVANDPSSPLPSTHLKFLSLRHSVPLSCPTSNMG